MTPQTSVSLTELDLPQEMVQLFRSFGAPTNDQRASILAWMESYSTRVPSSSPRQGSRVCKIKALESLFAPIRRLPSEVLVEIFRLYQLHDPSPISPPLDPQRDPSPFILWSVCAFWRAIVRLHPVLWSQMKIAAHGDCYAGVKVHVRHVEGIRSWMDRIGTHPWSLHVNVRSVTELHSPHTPLPEVLCHPAMAQLGKFRVDADESITGVENFTFPALESLVVRWREANSLLQTVDTAFPTVPNLKKLVVVNAITPNSFTDKLPWSSLTHLFIEGITTQKWRIVVSQCTSLEEACFLLEEPGNRVDELMLGDDHITPTVLPQLTRLTFVNRPPLHHDFQHLFFPGLEELTILHGESAFQEWNISTLRIFHNITKLTVVGAQPINLSTTIFPLLEAAPSVTDLRLHLSCNVEPLIQFLTYDFGRPRLSRLERLDLSGDIVPSHSLGSSDWPKESDRVLSPFTELGKMIRSRTGTLPHIPASSRSLNGIVFRIPMPPSVEESAHMIRVDEIGRQFTLEHGLPVTFVNGHKFLGCPFTSPPIEDRLDGYKHWDDGLMDFSLRI